MSIRLNRLERVLTFNVLSKNIENIENFLLNFHICFTAKNRCIFYWRILIMITNTTVRCMSFFLFVCLFFVCLFCSKYRHGGQVPTQMSPEMGKMVKMSRVMRKPTMWFAHHNENMPMKYTEICKVVKNENFQQKK